MLAAPTVSSLPPSPSPCTTEVLQVLSVFPEAGGLRPPRDWGPGVLEAWLWVSNVEGPVPHALWTGEGSLVAHMLWPFWTHGDWDPQGKRSRGSGQDGWASGRVQGKGSRASFLLRAREQRGAWPLEASGQGLGGSLAQRPWLQGLGGLGSGPGVLGKASRTNTVAAETDVGLPVCLTSTRSLLTL